jgi:regulatory protein
VRGTADNPTPGSPADDHVEADPEQVARTVLLRRLTAAPRTRADLRADLLKRNIPEDVADRVLDRFVDVGLVNDEQFAAMWVESRHRSRGTARSVLRQELRTKGVADESIAAALEQIDDDDERQRGLELARSKDRSLRRFDAGTRMRRLTSLLVRRGYRHGLAFAIARDIVGEDDPTEPGSPSQGWSGVDG